MEEHGQPAEQGEAIGFLEGSSPWMAAVAGVLVGFVVARYVLGLQPAPAAYPLIGGVGGGLIGSFWLVDSRHARIELARYRSPRCAVWGRIAQGVWWGSLWAGWCYIMYSGFWGYSSSDPSWLYLMAGAAGTIYYAGLKHHWEFALALAAATCAVSLTVVTDAFGLLPQYRPLVGILVVLSLLGGVVLFFWARGRTKRKGSGTTAA